MKQSSRTLLFAIPVVILLSSGCGGGGSNGLNNVPATALSRSASADGLVATLTLDKNHVTVGGSVNFTLTLTNTSNAAITYTPVGGCDLPEVIDGLGSRLSVTEPGSNAVVLLPPDADCVGTLEFLPTQLAPGATLTGTISSGALTNSGTYAVTAEVADLVTTGGIYKSLTIPALEISAR